MKQAVKTLTPEEVYTDRREFINYFFEAALNASGRRTMSTVLLGRRRMGKTEIFKRVVNRLFFEQDYKDPKAVVPVFYSFRDKALDRWEFALQYVENFLRWRVAFRARNPILLSLSETPRDKLVDFVETSLPEKNGLSGVLKLMESLLQKNVTIPEEAALLLPREVSDREDSTIAMFLDEFQNTRLPHEKFDVVGFTREAVESPTCPHFVTGSTMSILSKEILGRRALFGRFDSEPIEPLTGYWGAELARRAARYYGAQLDDMMAPVVSNRCGGNPFYISAVIRQAAKKRTPLADEKTLDALLAVDLSSGFIWAELNDQVESWIKRANEYGITKWVLYLSALEEGERIDPGRIQRRLAEKDGAQVGLDVIRNVLIRLSRGDLIEYMELGGWFRKVKDPILLDFLKAWGKFEVEGHRQTKVITDTIKQYAEVNRRINDQKGLLAEMYLSQILWNCQGKTLPGKYFHAGRDVMLPDRFYDILHRMRLDASRESEVDVYASTGTEIWLCESKWWETRKVGPDMVRRFLGLAEKLKDFEGREYFKEDRPIITVRLWLFAHRGVTGKAETLLRENGVYWSTRADLDWLVKEAGLRKLPVSTE
ncbi:MAG: hypothetical protein GY859_44010 [Desulfobacterales bacterium]|nr:hypothetical protein [Desulfobacterales bacterium]